MPDFPTTLEFYVGAMLWLLAVAVLLGARSRGAATALAVFLALVGLNFLLYGLYHLQGSPGRLRVLAAVTLAVDPFYLLYFATVYPYRTPSWRMRALVAAGACTSGLALAAVLLWPDLAAPSYHTGGHLSPPHLLVIGNLVLVYATAWVVAVAKVRDAPTPHLRSQATWTAAALAIVVLPRVGSLHSDFHLLMWWHPAFGVADPAGAVLRFVVGELPPLLAVAACGWAVAGKAEVRRLVLQCSALGVAVLLLHALLSAGGVGTPTPVFIYAGRWVLFAGLVVVSLGQGGLFDLRGPSWAVPLFLGISGGLGLALISGGLLAAQGAPPQAANLGGLMVGLASAGPMGYAGHALRRRVERRDVDFGGRAALFVVAASRLHGSAAERRRLLRHRHLFGLDRATALMLGRLGPVMWAEPRLGQEILPGLVLTEPLGQGGSGRVFRARRMDTGRSVVVKVVPVDGGLQAARLLMELDALRGLAHDRVVRLEEATVGSSGAVLVMEDVGARSLEEALREGPLPPHAVAAIARDMLSALEEAHRKGILHRDLKPANVLVTPDHRAYLIDFGLATGSGATAELPVGSLPYLAPEQACGAPVGEGVDIYGCAQVLYQALTGRSALDVSGLPVHEALVRAADPRIDFTKVPVAWRPVLRRALEADPRRRFASVMGMRRALDGALAGLTPAPRGGSVPPSPRRPRAAARSPPARRAAS